ncbi:MAG: copper chaperone PCu(A)C [Pikeienuella sp.]
MKTLLLSVAIAAVSAVSAWAADLMPKDPYAFATTASAKAGGAYISVLNHGDADRLLDAASNVAKRVEIHEHRHVEGVMKMRQVKAGIEVPKHGEMVMAPGGYHVMLMGLHAPLVEGETFDVTLIFEKAGEMTVSVPIVDRAEHKAGHGAHGAKKKHKHGS